VPESFPDFPTEPNSMYFLSPTPHPNSSPTKFEYRHSLHAMVDSGPLFWSPPLRVTVVSLDPFVLPPSLSWFPCVEIFAVGNRFSMRWSRFLLDSCGLPPSGDLGLFDTHVRMAF